MIVSHIAAIIVSVTRLSVVRKGRHCEPLQNASDLCCDARRQLKQPGHAAVVVVMMMMTTTMMSPST